MEEVEEVEEVEGVEEVEEVELDAVPKPIKESSYTEKNGFKFKHCAYIKPNDEPCKKQAPKKSPYCNTHRKMFKKRNE